MKYFSYIPFPERIYSIKETFVLFNGLFYSSGNTVSLMNVIGVGKGLRKKRLFRFPLEEDTDNPKSTECGKRAQGGI